MIDKDQGPRRITIEAEPKAIEIIMEVVGPLAAKHGASIVVEDAPTTSPELQAEPSANNFNPEIVTWATDARTGKTIAAISLSDFQEFAVANGFTIGRATKVLRSVTYEKSSKHRYATRDETLTTFLVAEHLEELVKRLRDGGFRIPGLSKSGAILLEKLSENIYLTDQTAE